VQSRSSSADWVKNETQLRGRRDLDRDHAAKHPTRNRHASGILPRDNLEFHIAVFVSVELAFRMSCVANGIPIAERKANHGSVPLFGRSQLGWSGQLRCELDQMREAEKFQWADLAAGDANLVGPGGTDITARLRFP
jgi:hypothetical protein